MKKIGSATKEFVFIAAWMFVPLIAGCLYEYIHLLSEPGEVHPGKVGELLEGFSMGTLFLILPGALIFWILLRLFYKGRNVLAERTRFRLAAIALLTIIGTFLVVNLLRVPEWLMLFPVPVGVLFFVAIETFLAKSESLS